MVARLVGPVRGGLEIGFELSISAARQQILGKLSPGYGTNLSWVSTRGLYSHPGGSHEGGFVGFDMWCFFGTSRIEQVYFNNGDPDVIYYRIDLLTRLKLWFVRDQKNAPNRDSSKTEY